MLETVKPFTEKHGIREFTAKFQLNQQLTSYGLNPNDWSFDQFLQSPDGRSGYARLIHRTDKNLLLKGTFEKEPLSLKKLLKWVWIDLAWDL